MTGHKMVVEFQVDCLRMYTVCEEPDAAQCHSVADCDCEQYSSLELDDEGWYHTFEEEREDAGGILYVEVKHRHHQSPKQCNYVEWLNNDPDTLEESNSEGQTFEAGRFDITPVWEGDYYGWKKS